LAAIDAESDNIRTAWAWTASRTTRTRTGWARSWDSLGSFYTWRGRYADGEAAFRLAAGRLAELGEALPVRLLAKALAWQRSFIGRWASPS